MHGSAIVGGFLKKSKTINDTFECRYVNLGTSASIEEIGRNSIRKLLSYVSLIWQVKKQLLINRPDLCYFTPTAAGPGFYKDALIITIVKLFGIKTVFHYHNKGVINRQGLFIDNILYRLAFKNTRVILLSKYLYPDIQKYVPEHRVYYCPNGIPDIQDKRKKEQGKSNNSVTEILFLSHLIRSKGILVLIDACSILREKGIEFHCTVVGGDAELKKRGLETIVTEKGLSSFISVVGPKHGDEKNELMRSADIFVQPTYNDCMPLVFLEAMQYSLPIVSTPEGAIPDVVDDGVTGYLVPQRDAVTLAGKLEVLIRDADERVKMGAAGRSKYKRDFTLEKFEIRLKEIFEEVGSA